MDWEDPWQAWPRLWNSRRSPKIVIRRSWKLLGSKKKMYIITKKSGSRRELKNIKNIKAKSSNKCYDSISDSSSDESYSKSSLSSSSNWYEDRNPAGIREINILYHAVTDNIKKNKDQHHDAIENEPTFVNSCSFSSGTKYPLPLVTVSLQGGKKHRAGTICVITCLWGRGATYSTI